MDGSRDPWAKFSVDSLGPLDDDGMSAPKKKALYASYTREKPYWSGYSSARSEHAFLKSSDADVKVDGKQPIVKALIFCKSSSMKNPWSGQSVPPR